MKKGSLFTQKGSQKGSFSRKVKPKISKVEKEILMLISDGYLTPKRIAVRRQTSVRAVQKIIKKLKEKGFINLAQKKVRFSRPTLSNFDRKHYIRLHGQEYRIKILWKGNKYTRLLKKGNQIQIDENKIRLFDKSIIIHIAHSFYAATAYKATAKSIQYLDTLLARLEHQLGVILTKDKYHNIKLVAHHYSEIKNELAKKCNVDKEKIKIYAKEDGKVWFEIDNSLNLHEAETKHPKTAEQDMQEAVQPFFNGLRENPGYTPGFVLESLGKTDEAMDKIIKIQGIFDKNMMSHIAAVKELGSGVHRFSSKVEEFIELVKKEKSKL